LAGGCAAFGGASGVGVAGGGAFGAVRVAGGGAFGAVGVAGGGAIGVAGGGAGVGFDGQSSLHASEFGKWMARGEVGATAEYRVTPALSYSSCICTGDSRISRPPSAPTVAAAASSGGSRARC